jgi:hypothetical protein
MRVYAKFTAGPYVIPVRIPVNLILTYMCIRVMNAGVRECAHTIALMKSSAY